MCSIDITLLIGLIDKLCETIGFVDTSYYGHLAQLVLLLSLFESNFMVGLLFASLI